MGRYAQRRATRGLDPGFGGWWTEAKLGILEKYLNAFNVASKNAGATVYLDLFAGRVLNRRPDTNSLYFGSSGIAMKADPPFNRLVFWELTSAAIELESQLRVHFPKDNRAQIIRGDCNSFLQSGLALVNDLRWAPTFAFVDPKGLDVNWTTLEQLSKWRRGKWKTELWVLFPETAFARVLGLDGEMGFRVEERLSTVFGSDRWRSIDGRRKSGELDAAQARAEYVNLIRWQLETDLGYKWTHALGLSNVSGHPVYTMIFATDNNTGHEIMSDVYGSAGVREIPELRSRALAARSQRRDAEKGIYAMFEVIPQVDAQNYEHEPPWEPPD